MVVVSHLFLFYGKISGADVTWYESHLPLFGTIYFPIAPDFHMLIILLQEPVGWKCLIRLMLRLR